MYAPRTQGDAQGVGHWVAPPLDRKKSVEERIRELEEPYFELRTEQWDSKMVIHLWRKRNRYFSRKGKPVFYYEDARIIKTWFYNPTPEAFEAVHEHVIEYLGRLVETEEDRQAVFRLAKEKGYIIG